MLDDPLTILNSASNQMLLISLEDMYMRSWLTPPASTERRAMVKMLFVFSLASTWSVVRDTSDTTLWNSLD